MHVLPGFRMVRSWNGLELIYKFSNKAFEALVATIGDAATPLGEVVYQDVHLFRRGDVSR